MRRPLLLAAALALGLLHPQPAAAAEPHAPSVAGKTYLRTPDVQAVRDRLWHSLGNRQWLCLDQLWQRESGWRVHAGTPTGSYGIAQAFPGSKMRSAGADWRDSAETQVRWGLKYIARRYGGSPCKALAHSDAWGWY